MLGYLQLLDSLVKMMGDVADWFGYVAGRVMHDPIWGGSVLVGIAVFIGLIVLKKRASN